jgi:HAMP domain-containing protein
MVVSSGKARGLIAAMTLFRRKKYFINTRVQLRFILFFLLEALAVVLITLGFIYRIRTKHMAEISRLQYDNQVYSLLINSFVGTELAPQNDRPPKASGIAADVVFFTSLLFAVVFIPSVIASHRIAGPLFKLNRTIRDVSRGVYSHKIAFRKRDSFKEVEDSFNDMLATLSYRKDIDLQDIDNVIQKILFLIRKNQANKELGLDAHEIRDILLKMKKRKMYNE